MCMKWADEVEATESFGLQNLGRGVGVRRQAAGEAGLACAACHISAVGADGWYPSEECGRLTLC